MHKEASWDYHSVKHSLSPLGSKVSLLNTASPPFDHSLSKTVDWGDFPLGLSGTPSRIYREQGEHVGTEKRQDRTGLEAYSSNTTQQQQQQQYAYNGCALQQPLSLPSPEHQQPHHHGDNLFPPLLDTTGPSLFTKVPYSDSLSPFDFAKRSSRVVCRTSPIDQSAIPMEESAAFGTAPPIDPCMEHNASPLLFRPRHPQREACENLSVFPHKIHPPFTQSLSQNVSVIPCSVVIHKLYFTQVSETVLLRDILYPLQGINGTYIKFHAFSNSFLLRQDVIVSTPVRVLVSRCSKIGTYYRRLQAYMEPEATPCESSPVEYTFSTTVPPLESQVASSIHPASTRATHLETLTTLLTRPVASLIHHSLCRFFYDHLSSYYKFLAHVENEVVACLQSKQSQHHGSFSLRKLLLLLQHPTEKMAVFSSTAEVTVGLKGGPLLSVIYDLSQRGDIRGSTLLKSMLTCVSTPWIDMVHQWVTNGVLQDPYNEFFIFSTVNTSQSPVHSTGAPVDCVVEDDNTPPLVDPLWFWTQGHRVCIENTPVFVSRSLVALILACGKAVALAKYFMLLESNLKKTVGIRKASTRLIDIQQGLLSLQEAPSPVAEPRPPSSRFIVDPATLKTMSPHQKHLSMLQHLTGMETKTSNIRLTRLEPLCDFTELHYPQNSLHTTEPSFNSSFEDISSMARMVQRLEVHNCRTVVNLLLYRYHVLHHCEAIRRFLLLAQGDFIAELFMLFSPTSVVSELHQGDCTNPSYGRVVTPLSGLKGCDLAQPASKVLTRDLRSCLDIAINSSNAQHLPDELLQRLEISKLAHPPSDRNYTAWEVVSLQYTVSQTPVALILDPLSISLYRQIHSLLWRTHRVSYALNLVWLNHIREYRRRPTTVSQRDDPSKKNLNCDLTLDRQWTIKKCENLYCEMSHFLRNLQSFFIHGVIEPSWFKFVEDTYNLVTQENTSASPGCQIDQLIKCHSNYLTSMLVGLFLDDVQPKPVEGEPAFDIPDFSSPYLTTFDILSDHPFSNSISSPISRFEKKKNTYTSNITLQLILQLQQCIMAFVTLANDIFLRLCSSEGTVPDSTKLDNLEYIAYRFRGGVIEFLKHMNTTAKVTDQSNITRGKGPPETTNIVHLDAIRALLYRLDFNHFYGSDWELYRQDTLKDPCTTLTFSKNTTNAYEHKSHGPTASEKTPTLSVPTLDPYTVIHLQKNQADGNAPRPNDHLGIIRNTPNRVDVYNRNGQQGNGTHERSIEDHETYSTQQSYTQDASTQSQDSRGDHDSLLDRDSGYGTYSPHNTTSRREHGYASLGNSLRRHVVSSRNSARLAIPHKKCGSHTFSYEDDDENEDSDNSTSHYNTDMSSAYTDSQEDNSHSASLSPVRAFIHGNPMSKPFGELETTCQRAASSRAAGIPHHASCVSGDSSDSQWLESSGGRGSLSTIQGFQQRSR